MLILFFFHLKSVDIDSLKAANIICPFSMEFLWFPHSQRMKKQKTRRQLSCTEKSGRAAVTSGPSQSIRYHIWSFNSQEGTEVGHPVKPAGICLRSDLSRPPCFDSK